MKSKILNAMDEYWVIHNFVEEGQIDSSQLRFGSKLQGKKMTLESLLLYFHKKIGGFCMPVTQEVLKMS